MHTPTKEDQLSAKNSRYATLGYAMYCEVHNFKSTLSTKNTHSPPKEMQHLVYGPPYHKLGSLELD